MKYSRINTTPPADSLQHADSPSFWTNKFGLVLVLVLLVGDEYE